MRVLFVTSYYWPATEWGGPARSVPMLIESLKHAGVDVSVITTTARGLPTLPRIEPGARTVRGVDVLYARSYGPSRLRLSPALLYSALRRARSFDLVHVQALWPLATLIGASTARLAGIPYAISLRGSLDPWALEQKAAKKHLYMRLAGDRLVRNAGVLHYTSELERSGVPERYRELRSVVIPNPVELDAFLAVPPPLANTRLQIAIVGRIHKKKGFDLLLPALAELYREAVDFGLTIIGPDEGGYTNEVRSLADRLGLLPLIRFAGHLPDRRALAAELASSDVVVMPSYQENFGMAAAEAMAAGRPLVVSTAVSLAADVRTADAGLVVPLAVQPIVQALKTFAADPGLRRVMGERGRVWASRHYDPDAVARAMRQAYENALSHGSRLPTTPRR